MCCHGRVDRQKLLLGGVECDEHFALPVPLVDL